MFFTIVVTRKLTVLFSFLAFASTTLYYASFVQVNFFTSTLLCISILSLFALIILGISLIFYSVKKDREDEFL
ncbi:hypothetical protein [Jeotgalibacillus campisalis]|uniref:Uncharacterized protein n=1 Tax=Jeotgalibacillus campisalis TaxID=220754 RepID=A0A0C2S173_9BACL|nr:hypothetical protein [Jeotgalibacillus campisalis]KIL47799.1 hypothetical protein KR50_19660 [Jeotgalibacillus campisalis]